MQVIIAGSRTAWKYDDLIMAVQESGFDITEVVSGCAPGADRLGERFAKQYNIPVKKFPADWNKHGKSAGVLRNLEMAEYAEALIALWDGKSKGTAHMIKAADAMPKYIWYTKA